MVVLPLMEGGALSEFILEENKDFAEAKKNPKYKLLDDYEKGLIRMICYDVTPAALDKDAVPKVVTVFAPQIINALKCLHSQDVIYRDLKLENILVSKCLKFAKITDFGLSIFKKNWLTESAGGTRCTAPNEVLKDGLPFRVDPPESWDWFSLGIVILKSMGFKRPRSTKWVFNTEVFKDYVENGENKEILSFLHESGDPSKLKDFAEAISFLCHNEPGKRSPDKYVAWIERYYS